MRYIATDMLQQQRLHRRIVSLRVLAGELEEACQNADDVHVLQLQDVRNLFKLQLIDSELMLLHIALYKLFVRSINDPVQDFYFAVRWVFMASCEVFLLWFQQVTLLCFARVALWRSDRTIETNERAWFNSTIDTINRRKWTATYSVIPLLLFCLVITIGYPIFRLCGSKFSQRFVVSTRMRKVR